MGDVDNNGEVNLADAQLALKVALKIQTLSDEDYPASLAADVDKDGSITLSDAKKILRYALKIDSEF